MSNRKIIIFISFGFIAASLVLALYYFISKPERQPVPVTQDSNKAIVFKNVKYTGERRGVVDWELTAKVARKYIDKPIIELEDLKGLYKPKPDVSIEFTGTKGSMDTENESGKVDNVEVFYKGEYTLKSPYMDFDFKNGITATKDVVDIKGEKIDMRGTGLLANTNEETLRLLSDVGGIIATEKSKYHFQSDTLLYYFQKATYVLEGKVILKGEDLNMVCDLVHIYSIDNEVDRIEADGNVRVISRGTVAKSEKAVYHFKEGRIVFTQSPRVFKDNVEMKGERVIYTTNDGKLSVERPKIRMERGK
ncbi:MAG: Lipopolysaccharide-assembly, LptC-related [Syntrophorhabdus sp. PtaB.Bin184]|jgi:LPS export ABC transporter protein LptC/lipopolysaccharide transport protein LptA|nr:MAG: Lipopolysaccharide-assembly, LptC-related [Syntrophorhabdus sp. PtaB.Bin184]